MIHVCIYRTEDCEEEMIPVQMSQDKGRYQNEKAIGGECLCVS